MADKFVKRSALALAAFGLSIGAHAQFSVTLYGTADAGLVYTNNQQTTHADGSTSDHANYQMAGGNLVPSRWGLMSTEDIGGERRSTSRWKTAFRLAAARCCNRIRYSTAMRGSA